MLSGCVLASKAEERLLDRNRIFEAFFSREAHGLAEACYAMSKRFLAGGRLLAFGRGPYATDAQHVSVEFVHPVIVGKRALPAVDLSLLFGPWLDATLRPEDIVIGFGPPEGDPEVQNRQPAPRSPILGGSCQEYGALASWFVGTAQCISQRRAARLQNLVRKGGVGHGACQHQSANT